MAEPQLPAQVQDLLAQLQNLQGQLQVAVQQRQQFEFQIKESERALEELAKIAADAPVYRNVGSLLIRTGGRDETKAQLTEDLETMKVRQRGAEKTEGRIKEKTQELQSKVQAAVKNLNLDAPRPAGKAKPGPPGASSAR